MTTFTNLPKHQRLACGLLFALACAATPVAAQETDPAAPPPIPPIGAQQQADERAAELAAERAAEQAAERTAQQAARQTNPDEDVPIPPKVQDETERLEPTVEIRRDKDDNIIEEYRLEGRVYMVKVTPKNGLPYFYMDDDGDGQLEMRESDRAAHPVKPVFWKIKEW